MDEDGPTPKRGGRPKREPIHGERIHLGVLVAPQVRRQLERIATANGRSMSQEAELRLVRSLDRQDLLPEVLTLAYGREAAGFLMMIGLVMKKAGDHSHVRSRASEDVSPWTENAVAIGHVAHAVLALLNAAKPSDQTVNPKFGLDLVSQLVEAIDRPRRKGWFTGEHQLTEAIRSLLGRRTVSRMIKAARGRRRLTVLDSDAQARQLQIAHAADAVATLLVFKDPNPTAGDVLRRPSRQEIFEVLTKGLAGAPTYDDIHQVTDEHKGKTAASEDQKP